MPNKNNKKIKIAHIITMLELGGAQQNTLYTIEHLSKEKFSCLLISGTGGILYEEAKKLQVKTCWIRYLIRPIRHLYDLLAFFSIYRVLLKEKPDVVHTHSSKAGILGRWAAHFSGVPFIIHTFHGFGFNDYQNSVLHKLFVWIEFLTAKITDKLIAVSEENMKTALKKDIGLVSQYELIRSGIKISQFKNVDISRLAAKKNELKIKPEEKVITTIGPFKTQKNIVDFVKAAKLVSQTVPDTRFIIIGDGPRRTINDLQSSVERLGLKERVIFTGWRKDIPELLAMSDIFVLTSLWEGLPRSIVEAMVSAKPVVAYAVDGVKEIVNDGVTGCPAHGRGNSYRNNIFENNSKR